VAAWQQLTAVTNADKYTVTFKWKIANPNYYGNPASVGGEMCYERMKPSISGAPQ